MARKKRTKQNLMNGDDDGAGPIDTLLNATTDELPDVIQGLMEQRERARDEDFARLQRESDELAESRRDLDRRQLLTELAAFKETLALHKRLMRRGGKRRR
jgi:hypothetical protein